jgi:hypothetical protein
MQAANREAYEKTRRNKRVNNLAKAERTYQKLLPGIRASLPFKNYLQYMAYGRLIGRKNGSQAHIDLFDEYMPMR